MSACSILSAFAVPACCLTVFSTSCNTCTCGTQSGNVDPHCIASGTSDDFFSRINSIKIINTHDYVVPFPFMLQLRTLNIAVLAAAYYIVYTHLHGILLLGNYLATKASYHVATWISVELPIEDYSLILKEVDQVALQVTCRRQRTHPQLMYPL